MAINKSIEIYQSINLASSSNTGIYPCFLKMLVFMHIDFLKVNSLRLSNNWLFRKSKDLTIRKYQSINLASSSNTGIGYRSLKKWLYALIGLLLLPNSFVWAAHIYGYIEKVQIDPSKYIVKAKLDTGAVSASLDAINVNEFIKDGIKWVSFDIPRDAGNIHLERKLVRYVRIKNRSGEMKKGLKHIATRRPVVNMLLTLGNQTKAVAVNLANRQNFNYPLLLGRRPLIIFNIAVDPAKTFVATLKQPNKKIWKSK